MSERGVFAIDRGIFDHPIFASEPYTEREAWIWIIGAAAWKPRRVRVGRRILDLERGQLAFSTRFLAKKFKWPHSRLVRYVSRLETDSMVSTSTTRDATRLTICNYNKYAFDRNTSETQTETQTDTPVSTPTTRDAKHLTDCNYDENALDRNTNETQTGTPNETPTEHPRNKDKERKKVIKKEGLGDPLSEEASASIPSKANEASKPERTKRHQTQWPEGLALNHDMRAYAVEHGWTTPARQDAEFEKYHQHALQTGRLLKDWVAGWRSWVLKGTEFDRPRIAALTVSAAEPAPVDWNSRVAKFKTNGLWPLPWGPQPGSAGCKAPVDVLDRHGYSDRGEALGASMPPRATEFNPDMPLRSAACQR